MFQMREIWPFCNVYSKENGPQLGATIQRAKNMHAIYDSRITLKLFYAKKRLQKGHHIRKVSCLKSSFLYCLFFALHPANFYKFVIFWHFWKWSHFSNIGWVLNLFFAWNKPKIVKKAIKTIIQLVILTLQAFWSSTLKIYCILAILRY